MIFNIMKFEEQFPSLKDKYENCTVPTYPDGTIKDDGLVTINNVQEHCIDKQKVRDVFDKLDKYINQPDSSWRDLVALIYESKDKLGLVWEETE